jgi:hypothetical protein
VLLSLSIFKIYIKNGNPNDFGQEGLADIHIINAIQESLVKGISVKVKLLPSLNYPDISCDQASVSNKACTN